MPRVMISGWTLNTPMPMPLTTPASAQAARASRSATIPPWSGVWVAMMNAAIEAIIPTERSMPPVSIVSVWQAARIASGTAARIADADPIRADGPRLDDLEDHDEDDQQAAERHERPIAEQPAPAVEGEPRAPTRHGRDVGGHTRVLRMATTLPNMTTPMRIAPWRTVARFGGMFEQRHVRLDEGEDEDREDRAGDATTAAREAHATEDDRRNAEQRVVPRDRRPDARWSRSGQAHRTPRTVPSAHRRRPSSGRSRRRS